MEETFPKTFIIISLFINILEGRLGHELFSALPYYLYSFSLTTLLSSLTPTLHFINNLVCYYF